MTDKPSERALERARGLRTTIARTHLSIETVDIGDVPAIRETADETIAQALEAYAAERVAQARTDEQTKWPDAVFEAGQHDGWRRACELGAFKANNAFDINPIPDEYNDGIRAGWEGAEDMLRALATSYEEGSDDKRHG